MNTAQLILGLDALPQSNQTQPAGHSHQIWDPVEAHFNAWFYPFISTAPSVVALCCLFWCTSRLFLPKSWRPGWTKAFVQEAVPAEDEPGEKTRKHSYYPAAALFLLSIIAIIVQLLFFANLEILATWAVSTLLVAIERPSKTPIALLVLQCVNLVCLLIILLGVPGHSHGTPWIAGSIIAFCMIVIILCMPLRDPKLPNEDISPAFSKPTSQLRSPEENLTLWQFMSFSWMTPLIRVGLKRPVADEDVWSLSHEFRHRPLHDNFRALHGSVLRRLLRANGTDLILISLMGVIEVFGNLALPVLLQQLLRSLEDPLAPSRASVLYASLAMVVRVVYVQTNVFSLWYSRRAYERSRGELITMLSEKTLSRKIVSISDEAPTKTAEEEAARKAKEAASMGKILNLMRYDAYEVAQRFWEFASITTIPLGAIFSTVLIWRIIGWPCLIGVVTIIIAQVLNAFIARIYIGWERRRRAVTDTKLQRISQFVEAVRHLRWYGWEDAWLTKIMDARHHELNLRIISSLWNMLISVINNLASGLFPVTAFYAYTVWAGQPLHLDIAFPALQLFGLLESALRELPNLLTTFLNASVAMGRVEAFMKEPDIDKQEPQAYEPTQLRLDHATFAWPGRSDPVLKDISMSFPVGLTVVCGEVAAGKTAVLQALLGELDMQSGLLDRPNEMIGYCAQTPWLQSMSIRDNILFSAPFDLERYRKVLDACALTPDMASFKNGDLENIGENGIGLSGGQKARVALARAVYSRAKVLLLDDPISALDHQTAEAIVRRCLGGPLMKDRTVVLVTHRIELCQGMARQYIDMSEGTAHVLDPNAASWTELRHVTSSQSATEEEQGARKAEEDAAIPEKFMEDEHMARGGVQFSIYWEYVKAGTLRLWALLIVVLVIYRAVDVAETWFLKIWGEAYDKPVERIAKGPLDDLPAPDVNIRPWLIGYLLIAVARSAMLLVYQLVMLVIVYMAGKKLFRDVVVRISHATFHFYDVTPVGRLMNRMTSDISTVDGDIADKFQRVARQSLIWITSIVIIASVTPTFLAFALALTAACLFVFLRFLPTSQSLRRLEMISLSPLMSNLGALVEGLTTVRAFQAQHDFQERVIGVTDTFQKMDHFYWSLQGWLSYRFGLLAASSTLIITLLAIYTGVSAGLTAFVLMAAAKFVNATHQLCRTYGQLQMDFVSVERVVEMLHVEQEPEGDIEPPAWWPTSSSTITFDSVTLQYAPHLPPSISNLTLTIPAGSATALIGRTGSGKSTLALSLLATIRPTSGRILIDGISLAQVSTSALRSRITFLAQDPVLFPGSMRMNLDPLSEYSDTACAAVLAKIAGRHDWALDTVIDTGGKNLSQGQRQLVGLARALLRRSAIVILDEATASIDLETSMRIQEILREELAGSTVITIAHRLEAVRDATFCVVLGKGELVRCGTVEEMRGHEGFVD